MSYDRSSKHALLLHPDPWSCLTQDDGSDCDLAELALLVARDEYPALDWRRTLGQLDAIAEDLRRAVGDTSDPIDRVRSLNRSLFEQCGFAGNYLDYYDPRNSYLNDVLDRRLGIPLSLSIVYLSIGRKLGLNLQGVSFPGHFLVRLPLEGGLLILDPFHRGKSIGADELRLRASSARGREVEDARELFRMLEPASSRAIVERMLSNLKSIYAQRGDHERALRVAHRLVQVRPSAEHVRDRGLCYHAIGAVSAARRDLARYLAEQEQAPDAASVRSILVELERVPARLQ